MFKIVENADGSTSVFCKESGRLICRVKGKKPSAVAVGRPLLRDDCKSHKTNKRRSPSLPKEDSPLEKKKRIEAWADTATNSDSNSFVSNAESTSSEEPSDECVDQDSFLNAFDLIDTSKLKSVGPEKLRCTFPRRRISRVGPLAPIAAQSSLPRTLDDAELCSPLGMRLWQSRYKLGPTARELAVKKYDKYCKISVLSLHPNLTLHPALRNRESMKYGVTFRPPKGHRVTTRHTHLYSFSSRQRQERYLQLVTGLNRHSRQLRDRCKNPTVRLVRMMQREIDSHTARRDVPEDGSGSEDDCVIIREVIRMPHACTVPLEDVSQRLVPVGGHFSQCHSLFADGTSLQDVGRDHTEI